MSGFLGRWTAAAITVGCLVAPLGARADASCSALAAIHLPHAAVTGVSSEIVGGATVCRIDVTSRPTADSDIRIQVRIPLGAAWNGKFVQLGNGGFAGSIPIPFLAALAARGYAVAATDDGHQTRQGTDATWALGHPQKIIDFGWRSLKETTDASKALIGALEGSAPARSYFEGCSDGGREALMEAQRFPLDFDGIVAGAPAADFTRLLGLAAQNQQSLLNTPGAYIPPANLAVLQAGALAACGGEGFIRDPLACRFDPVAVQCRPGQDAGDCLTPAQVVAARSIYGGLRDPRTGKVTFPGSSPGGEAQPGGWAPWITGPSRERAGEALSARFAAGFFEDFAFGDPNFDVLTLDLGPSFAAVHARLSGDLDAVNPDLGAFRAHGGKLIQFHGWNDPAIPTRGSIVYYQSVARRMGDVSDFYRLYLVPGMLHCGGGAGPGNVDWLTRLDAWVTRGEAPGAVMADSGDFGRPAPADGPTQLLCPYPAVARRAAATAGGAAAWRCPAGPRNAGS